MAKTKMVNDIHQQSMKVLALVQQLSADIGNADDIDANHLTRFRSVDTEIDKLGQMIAALEKHISSWDGSTSLKTKMKSQAKLAQARNNAKGSLVLLKTRYKSLEADLIEVMKDISSRNWTPARPATAPPARTAPPRPAQGPVSVAKH